MNRDLYHPITLGAIMTSVVMAFSILIPLNLLLVLTAFTITVHLFYRKSITFYLVILILSIFLGVISNYRVLNRESQRFLPITIGDHFTGDIIMTGDSRPVSGGYLTGALCIKQFTRQFESEAGINVMFFSKEPFYRGTLLEKVKIKKGDKGLSAYLKSGSNPSYNSKLYLLRADIMDKLGERTSSPLLFALLTGNRSKLKKVTIDMFRESGCSHILALSGFHVGIIIVLIAALLRIFFTGKKVLIIGIAFLLFYLIFAGMTPSLLRSVIMFATLVVTKIMRRKVSVFRALVVTFYISIIIAPSDFNTLSFRLSYMALTGILTMGQEIVRLPLIRLLPGIIKSALSASLAAMIATSFITIPIFGVLYPAGVIASIVLTPLITLFMWFGVVSIIFQEVEILIFYIEKAIIFLLGYFSEWITINNSLAIYPFVTLISLLIPAILLILKLYRRFNAGRFNLKFKL